MKNHQPARDEDPAPDKRYGIFNQGPDALFDSMYEFDPLAPEQSEMALTPVDDLMADPGKLLLPEIDELQAHPGDLIASNPSRRDSQDNDDDIQHGDSGEPIVPLVP